MILTLRSSLSGLLPPLRFSWSNEGKTVLLHKLIHVRILFLLCLACVCVCGIHACVHEFVSLYVYIPVSFLVVAQS